MGQHHRGEDVGSALNLTRRQYCIEPFLSKLPALHPRSQFAKMVTSLNQKGEKQCWLAKGIEGSYCRITNVTTLVLRNNLLKKLDALDSFL